MKIDLNNVRSALLIAFGALGVLLIVLTLFTGLDTPHLALLVLIALLLLFGLLLFMADSVYISAVLEHTQKALDHDKEITARIVRVEKAYTAYLKDHDLTKLIYALHEVTEELTGGR